MSYVPSFEYDIFISFTHADNDPLPGGKLGWVDEFHEQLENWLARRRGLEGLRIWRDRELHGNTDFDAAIEDKLDSTALFFVLHSRAYRKSDYCRKELDWFHRKCRNSLLVGEHKRIFNILLDNYPLEEWHPALGKAIGFPMHNAEGNQVGDLILPTDPEYPKRLRPIIDAAETILRAMRARQEVSPEPPSAPRKEPEGTGKVFLSYADKDWDRIKHIAATLTTKGWEVWWDREDLPPGQRIHRSIDEAIRSSICVAVFWSRYSVDSDWVIDEAMEGKKLDKLLPIRLDAVDPPYGFRSIHCIDLISANGKPNRDDYNRLLRALEYYRAP